MVLRLTPLPASRQGRWMLTVASYNMRKAIGTDRLRKPERTLEVLCEIDADVVALQEADRRFGARASAIPPEMIEAKTPYKPVDYDIRPDSIGWHGNALLVDKEATILDQRALALPTLEPRGAVVADLALNGAEFGWAKMFGQLVTVTSAARERT